ncbi:ptc-1, partial [Pristionchus pacificus]
MLTLLEPPGAKQHQRFQSGQYLLNLGGGAAAGADDEDYDDDEGIYEQQLERDQSGCCAPLEKILDRQLVGKSSSNEYSARWKREFRQRPSWCDADLCLQQIKRVRMRGAAIIVKPVYRTAAVKLLFQRKAKGNRWALYSRSFIQKALHSLGTFVQEHAWSVIVTVLLLFSLCCYGLQYVRIETDIVKLWVAKGGRLDEELSFHKRVLESVTYNHSRDDQAAEVVRENGLGGGYQVVIQTPEYEEQNMLTREGLLKHVAIMEEIANISINKLGIDWTLSDLCFKPAKPDTSDPMARKFEGVIDKIIPCIWITPIDCFWEGSKPLGPDPAVNKNKELGMLALGGMLDHIDGVDVSWKNLNPTEIIHGINKVFSLGTYALMFDRAGIGKGYLDRPCIDPLDPECPRDAPNYFETCESGLIDRWVEMMEKRGEKIELKKIEEFSIFDMDFGSLLNRKKRQAEPLEVMAEADEAMDPQNNSTRLESVVAMENVAVNVNTTTTTTASPIQVPTTTMTPTKRKEYCTERHGSMLQWMAKPENRHLWNELLGQHSGPRYPDYPTVMSDGCGGFARGVLQWPSDMILGAAKRDVSGALQAASALQSVFLVASPNDVYLRFKTSASLLSKPQLADTNWTTAAAEEVIVSWQRAFTQLLYKHKHNFETTENGVEKERRTIHPLASTSIADMLEEFCQFNYTIILVGYGLMLVYAMVTQLRTERCLPAAHSCMGLAFAGVVTVTFASVAGLGMATWFGIEFNAATTQIVPFLTLGIGVDNMFMLLHNYHDVVAMSNRNEMGVLLRETGMSILCTSTNNILSFLAGTLLPIPALRSFCAQSTILLTFNFIAILTIYPAVISIDLRRRKAGKRDILCCLPDPVEENYRQSKQQPGRKPMNGEASYRNLISKTSHHQKEIEVDDSLSHGHHGFLEEVVPYTLHAAIRNYYIPFISNKCVKVAVIMASIGLCVVAVMGMQQASIGLELSDVLPEHTAPAAFLKARDSYFSFYPMFAVLKGPHIDYPHQQQLIENYRNTIGASQYVIKNARGQPSEAYWLGMMRDWLMSIQNQTDQAIARGQIDVATASIHHSNSTKISDAALTGFKLLCSHGEKYECMGRVGKVRLVDATGVINPDGFYNYLTAWFNQDNMMYYVTQASFFPNPPSWAVNVSGVVPAAEPLAYSQIPFYLTGLTNTPVIVEVIKEIRSICDDFTIRGLPNFPQGIAFTFWEQYLHLNGNLMQAIATIALAVFVVLSVLLFNPWAAASILAILVCMTIQLAGFLGWAGIKMNPVSAVTLITAVGIGVEFTAHVVLAFLTSLGNRQERMAAAVDRVFVPVIHGALSTLLGILMLA